MSTFPGPVLYPAGMSDLVNGLRDLADARPDLDEAEAMYEGTADEVIASIKLSRLLGESGTKFRLNYSRAIVSARMDKLELSSVTAGDDPDAQKIIDEWWSTGQLADETHDVTESVCEFGEAVVIVWPNDEDADGNFTDVDIYFNDPRVARVMYDPENPREMLYVVKVWTEPARVPGGEKLTRVNLYYPDRVERYVSKGKLPAMDRISDADFDIYVDDAGIVLGDDGEPYEYEGTWPIPTPLSGRMNAFHFRTGRPHGRPVHKDAYGPQNAVNKFISTLMGNVDFIGLPQRWALEEATNGGISEVQADFEDGDIALTDERPRGTEDSANGVKAEPGSIAFLKNVKDTGTYEPIDPARILEPWDKFVQGMSVVTKTPMSAFRIGGELPSGAARRADDKPLNDHVRDLRRRMGATWREVYSYALEVVLGRPVDVTLSWAPLEDFDDAETWEVATAQIAAGVPLRRVLTERGYTDEQCDKWGVPAYGDRTVQQKASDLAALAASMRDLGTAQQLGVVDGTAVKTAIDAVLTPASSGD